MAERVTSDAFSMPEDPASMLRLQPEDPAPLVAFLRKQRISKRKIAVVLDLSGCTSKRGFALFLRLHLPPLAFANQSSVHEHMHRLLGVEGRKANRLIEELRVAGA